MKTAQYNTGTKSLLFVVVPKDCKDRESVKNTLGNITESGVCFGSVYIPECNATFINTLSNITEGQCNRLGIERRWIISPIKRLRQAVYYSGIEVTEKEDVLILELNQ